MVVINVINIEEFGLKLIRVPLPFNLDHVNCFLAESENGWTLIDTGLHNEETMSLWHNIFEKKDIQEIIVTHEHPDHIGCAGYLQQTYDINIYLTEQAFKFSSFFVEESRLMKLKNHYNESGIPENIIDQLMMANKNMIETIYPLPNIQKDSFLNEGEQLLIGNNKYEVIFTPGHADGLFTLFNKENSVLIAADHLLPKITPNISYWFFGQSNPLHLYLQSLEKIKKLNAHIVVPSHGKPFYNANKRIDEIIIHHEERLDQILAMIQKDRKTIYEITNEMFPRELTSHEMRFAIGEAIAHLQYLQYKNLCDRKKVNHVWKYIAI